MYTRVPERNASNKKIKIPDNYSGNAFSEQSLYNQPLSVLPNKAIESDEKPQESAKINTEKERREEEGEVARAIGSSRPDSLLSSLFPSKSLKNHFPFGHGIGSEEILILGIMSLIFFSDDKEPDGELIMLLALLLFAG